MVSKIQFLSAEECDVIIKQYLQSDNFKVLQYEEKPLKKPPNQHISIKINILVENKQREVRFIAKSETSSNNRSQKNIPLLKLLFKDSGSTDFAPKHYFVENNNLIIYEDLCNQGFEISKCLDLDHIKLCLEALAKYHASTIILEEKKSKDLGKQYRIVNEYPTLEDKATERAWFREKLTTLNALIDCIPLQKATPDKLKSSLNKISETKSNNKFRNVLCHSSLWNNNVFFKYDENRFPIECKITNFEAQQYNPPAVDVLQFIYMATTQENRKHHFHDLLHLYYTSLKTELKAANLDLNQLLPLEEDFKISVHHFLPLIKLQTACINVNTTNSGLNNDLSSVVRYFKTNEGFRKSVTKTVLELEDLILHPELTIEDVFKIIKNKTGTTNYELINYKLVPLEKIAGYLGDHNKLKINIIINNQTTTLNLFAKFMPKTIAAISLATDTNAFYKEIFFYQHFVPMIKKFGVNFIDECTVPCYFTRQDDVIIFDDLEILNYKMLEPREPFSFEAMCVVITKMAKFHACGIILEEKLNEKTHTNCTLNQRFPKEVKESLFLQADDHQGAQCVLAGINAVEHELELFPDQNFPISDSELKIKIKKAFLTLYELVKPSKIFRNVFCHGDLWSSNVLVQSQDGKPTDCRFIDFQICRYCPPVQDLISFMYLTTNRSVRKQHQVELIHLYYEELSKNLKTYGYEIDSLYPYDEFIKSIDYITPQAVCQTVLYYHLGLTNSDILKEHMSDEESTRNILLGDRRAYLTDVANRDPLFKERASESIQDLREMCQKYF